VSRHGFVRFLARFRIFKHIPLPRWLVEGLEGASGKWSSPYKALSRKLCGVRGLQGWCNLSRPCPIHDEQIPFVIPEKEEV
jgi:hypothetical protein